MYHLRQVTATRARDSTKIEFMREIFLKPERAYLHRVES